MHICVGGFCWLQEKGQNMKWANSCFSEVNEWFKAQRKVKLSSSVLGNLKRTKFAHFLCMKSSCKSKSQQLQKIMWLWPSTQCCMVASRRRRLVWCVCQVIHVLHAHLVGLLTKPQWSLWLVPEWDGFCNIHLTSYSSPSRCRVVHTTFYWLTKLFSNSAAPIEHISDCSLSQRPYFWNEFIFSMRISKHSSIRDEPNQLATCRIRTQNSFHTLHFMIQHVTTA